MTPKRPNGAGAFPIPVEHPVPTPPDPSALYAALDLGTNSCRMLIAQPKGSQFHVVDSFSKSVQLGQGLERLRFRFRREVPVCVSVSVCVMRFYSPSLRVGICGWQLTGKRQRQQRRVHGYCTR